MKQKKTKSAQQSKKRLKEMNFKFQGFPMFSNHQK